MTIDLTIRDIRLARVAAVLDSVQLSQAMGEGVKEKTREHLAELAGSRHTTADRLGASPTGHLAMAARAVESASVSADAASASFSVRHPGLGRAFHDVTITPGGGRQFLTIPLNAIAYGRRISAG